MGVSVQENETFIGISVWFPNILFDAHGQHRCMSKVHNQIDIFSFSFTFNKNNVGLVTMN